MLEVVTGLIINNLSIDNNIALKDDYQVLHMHTLNLAKNYQFIVSHKKLTKLMNLFFFFFKAILITSEPFNIMHMATSSKSNFVCTLQKFSL